MTGSAASARHRSVAPVPGFFHLFQQAGLRYGEPPFFARFG